MAVRAVRAVVASSLAVLLACGRQEATLQVGPEAWRDDLRFLARELPRRHVNAFHTATPAQFSAAVAQLYSAIPKLGDDGIIVELMRIVALIGDGHTHLDLPSSWPRYPYELSWFGDELRIVAAPASASHMLGRRVMELGGSGIETVTELASFLVPRGENDARTRLTATAILMSPRVLHGLGVSPSNEWASIHLAGDDGRREHDTLTAADLREITAWRVAGDPVSPLWLRRPGEQWWAEAIPQANTVYLSFSGYPPAAEFQRLTAELGALLDHPAARRVVVDLRRNQGGDLTLGRRFLLPVLQERRASGSLRSVYAIIGPRTFSAAMVNALDLKTQAGATLVGEPTGARPNSYSEHGDFRLPNSGLRVSYSTRFYRFGADSADAVYPDKRIEPKWDEFRAGLDPAMDWITKQPIP